MDAADAQFMYPAEEVFRKVHWAFERGSSDVAVGLHVCSTESDEPDAVEAVDERWASAFCRRFYGQTPRNILAAPHPSIADNAIDSHDVAAAGAERKFLAAR